MDAGFFQWDYWMQISLLQPALHVWSVMQWRLHWQSFRSNRRTTYFAVHHVDGSFYSLGWHTPGETFLIVQEYYVWIGLRICCGMQYVSFTVSKPRSMRLCPFGKALCQLDHSSEGYPPFVFYPLVVTSVRFLRWRRFMSFFSSVFATAVRVTVVGPSFRWLVRRWPIVFFSLRGFLSMRGFEYCFNSHLGWMFDGLHRSVASETTFRWVQCFSHSHWWCVVGTNLPLELYFIGLFRQLLPYTGLLDPSSEGLISTAWWLARCFCLVLMKYLWYSLIPRGLHTAIWIFVCALSCPDEIA